jgi:mono/diheme cytochrome c family protein
MGAGATAPGYKLAAFALGAALFCAGAGAQEPAGAPFPAEQIRRGAEIYSTHCVTCHGIRLANPEWAADLRTFPKGERARFVDTVTYGVRNMPAWGDLIKPDEVEALWAYVTAGEK